MAGANGGSRVLIIVGLVAMAGGAVDPLEGSIVILAGTFLVLLGTLRTHPHRTLAYWSFGLVTVGVGAMWALSAAGGMGGDTGRSYWWSLVLLPYPVGWIMGLVGGVRRLRG